MQSKKGFLFSEAHSFYARLWVILIKLLKLICRLIKLLVSELIRPEGGAGAALAGLSICLFHSLFSCDASVRLPSSILNLSSENVPDPSGLQGAASDPIIRPLQGGEGYIGGEM